MVDGDFIRKRISELRIQKGVSEYKMSFDLGHSKGYIQSISSGRALPSMPEFLYICDYFGITPKEFFDTEVDEPVILQELFSVVKDFSSDDLKALIGVAKRMGGQK